MHNDEIIHVIGGVNDYVGKFDSTPHPRGEGWIRIKEPCLCFLREDPGTKKIMNVITRLIGPPGKNNYRNYVDIYIPDCMPMEIRTLDQNGEMYRIYREEINKKKSILHLPDNDRIVSH